MPAHGDWVLVLNDHGTHHALVEEALASGARFLHRGLLFDGAWEGGAPFVRWSGDVLARAAGGMVRTADGVFDLLIEGDGGRQTLEVTPEHPFWVAGTGWLWVEDLAAGDVLRTLDGSEALVVEKAWRSGDVEVFNIAVEGAHTYFVGGWTPVLAHNCGALEAAQGAADQAQGLSKSSRPGAASGLETPSGNVHTGTSGSSAGHHPDVQAALDAVPLDERSAFHGCCGETRAMTNALNAGDSVRGGTQATVNVRSPSSSSHGARKEPCSSCSAVQDALGVSEAP